MNKFFSLTILILAISLASCRSEVNCSCAACGSCNPVKYTGWAIGWYVDIDDPGIPLAAAIVHTNDSGHTWTMQSDISEWAGFAGNDISAVDEQTAWAALGGTTSETDGAILHTADSGQVWARQTLPASVQDSIKGVKGLSRTEAWAVSLHGTILHTIDAGNTWNIVPHPGIAIGEINRIDAIGPNIWMVDHLAGVKGIIRSNDNGLTWQQDTLPPIGNGHGPLAINAFSPSVVWSAVNGVTSLFRTMDGGDSWVNVAPDLSGMNDFDDICAGGKDWVWAVLNQGGFFPGTIFRVGVAGPAPVVQKFDPGYLNYQYEGVTCFDENNAWVVGHADMNARPELPQAVIVHTNDGHSWENQLLPADNIRLWKVSFVGAKR